MPGESQEEQEQWKGSLCLATRAAIEQLGTAEVGTSSPESLSELSRGWGGV